VRWEKWILSKLFIAVPELGTNATFTERLLAEGIISRWQLALLRELRKSHPGVKPLAGVPLLQRLLQIAPELLSVRLMDALTSMRLVSTKDAHILRVLLRVSSRLVPGQVSDETIYTRLGVIFDDVFSPSMVAYLRALDNEQIDALAEILRRFPEGFGLREAIFGHRFGTLTSGDGALIREMLARSVARAQILRSVISTGRQVRATLAQRRELDDIWGVMTLAFDNVFSDKLLRNLIRAGLISPERYALARSLQELGAGVWRKTNLAHTYEGWAARSLLLSEGIISPETIKVLTALGIISPVQAQLLYPVAQAIRGITRTVGSKWRTSQRYRIVPGEKPIRTFARMTTQTDKAILKLLAAAAEDARREAERLAGAQSFAKLTRANQQRMVTGAIHHAMRDIFENVGSLIIFGEKEAAQAALESMTWLQKPYGQEGEALQRMLRFTAQAGVDSYISREENLHALSRRVYGNINVLRGRVDKEIAKSLLRGQSAAELALTVRRFINPDTPGGASYAAMRLARTEINNAFHFTQIRYTREMPWVEGYKWNLSGSHGRVDVCNDMAEHSEGHGRGVYGKGDVPGKPHPMCLCFITTVSVDNATFYKRYRSGAYDRYVDGITQNGVFAEDTYTPETVADVGRNAGRIALLNVLVTGARVLSDMLRSR
jgi:hypothetical protein